MNNLNKHKLAFEYGLPFALFVVTYIILYALSIFSQGIHASLFNLFETLNSFVPIFWPLKALVDLVLPLNVWESPMYSLLPIPGFFFAYMIADWVKEFLELDDFGEKLLLFVFWTLVILAYLTAILVQQYNYYYLTIDQNPQLKDLGFSFTTYLSGGKLNNGEDLSGIGFNFWAELKKSAYLVFCLAAFFGWLSRKFVLRLAKEFNVQETVKIPKQVQTNQTA